MSEEKTEKVKTFWNKSPCKAEKVTVIIAPPMRTNSWCYHHVGKEWPAVKVSFQDETFYIDNLEGKGWEKVTKGMGSPFYPHRIVSVATTAVSATKVKKNKGC